jgi:hypothetical protein
VDKSDLSEKAARGSKLLFFVLILVAKKGFSAIIKASGTAQEVI